MCRDVATATEYGSEQAARHRDRRERAGGVSQTDILIELTDRVREHLECGRRPAEPGFIVQPGE